MRRRSSGRVSLVEWAAVVGTAVGVWLYGMQVGSLSRADRVRQADIEGRLQGLMDTNNRTIRTLVESLAREQPTRVESLAREQPPLKSQNPLPPSTKVWEPIKLSPEDWVVYLRVQKTGSQTLWLTLLKQFDGSVWGRRQCPKGPFCGYKCDMAEAFRTSKCKLLVRAHANLYDYERGAAVVGVRRLRWLALLREPVARAVSEYEHVTHGLVAQFGPHVFGKAWDYNFTDRRHATLTAWLDCEACRVGSSNRQTRFLAGLATTGSRDDEKFGDDHMFDAALRNLRKCDFVGVLDRYADSMLLLKETFPTQLAHFTSYALSLHPKQKESGGKPSADVLDRVRQLNRLDIRLYDAAKAIFEERWAAMLDSLPPGRREQRFRPSRGRRGQYTLEE